MSDRPVRRGAQLPRATLGKKRAMRFTYDAALLEAVPLGVSREFAGQSMWVSNLCLRFTSLCPVTGQPDWADLHLNYIPDRKLVESKSLKEYLHSFRMHGDFHEDVCRIVCDDLVRLLAPRYLEVIGHFDSRGSIAIWPFVQHAKEGDAEADEILRHRRREYSPGKFAPKDLGRNI
jgi:7-cyano-7-deazaguanine reductase